MQRLGRAEYLSGKHGETNWYGERVIGVELSCGSEEKTLSRYQACARRASAKQQPMTFAAMTPKSPNAAPPAIFIPSPMNICSETAINCVCHDVTIVATSKCKVDGLETCNNLSQLHHHERHRCQDRPKNNRRLMHAHQTYMKCSGRVSPSCRYLSLFLKTNSCA